MFLCVLVALLTPTLSPATTNALLTQDIDGAATKIFGRPADPEVNREPPMGGGTQRSNNQGKRQPSVEGVEDALELGNAARNSKPPRYHDAELAYRLAAKLDSKDPRPLMGLANIWYDQQQFEAAARMYREAFMRMSTAAGGSLRSEILTRDQRSGLARLHGSAGVSLVQAEKLAEAQIEFAKAISAESTNARWHALQGYCLWKRGKTDLATKELEEAVRLEPTNEDYQKLLAAVK